MKVEEIIQNINNNNFAKIYLLHGEEAFFIDTILDNIQQKALTKQEQEFNQVVFYGKDAVAENIINSAMQYPMMAQRKVVILKEAQQMRDLEKISNYVENPVDSTVLVITYKGKKYDMRKSLGKLIKKNGIVFTSNKLYENQIPNWIRTHSKSLGMDVNPDACSLMTTLIGTELSKIDNELKKLKILAKEGTTVGIKEIKENIGMNREFTVFELTNALGENNIAKVFTILKTFESNPSQYSIIMISSILFNYFSKLLIIRENIQKSDAQLSKILGVSSYFIRTYINAAKKYSRDKLIEVFQILKEYDLKSKGIEKRSTTDVELLKEMIIRITSK